MDPYEEDPRGLPLWFVMGLGSTSILLCAMYPVWRTMQARGRTRQPLAPAMIAVSRTAETLETELRDLKRECVPVDRLQEDDTCPICLSKPVDDLSEHLLIPPCRHVMHVACAQAWLVKHLQCPLCRRSFETAECVVWELQEASGRGDEATGDDPESSLAASSSAVQADDRGDDVSPDQQEAVAVLRNLIADIKSEMEDHTTECSIAASFGNEASDMEGTANALPPPVRKSRCAATALAYTRAEEGFSRQFSDPRSPITCVSIDAAVLGRPQAELSALQGVSRREERSRSCPTSQQRSSGSD